MLIRTWNVFHGNSVPPRWRGHLPAMLELVSADGPDVVCLQELPIWSLERLEEWSGMRSLPAVARPPLRPRALSALATRLASGHLRSSLTGQANAILVRADLAAEPLGEREVSEPDGRERRICHALRMGGVVVATTHLSSPADVRGQRAELERCAAFALSVARPGEPVAIAGDLNLHAPLGLDGFSGEGPWIDHVLVRGAPIGEVTEWPLERRVQNGRVLSDHAPVEARIDVVGALP